MKPIVFNYSDYEKVVEENKKLKAEVANLQIRCRIAESNNDRDCKNCKHQKPDGCSRWECEFERKERAMSDLISRQDAIDILDDFESDIELGERDSYKTHRGRLLSLPSADRPTVDKEYLIDLIQEAVYDGEACAKLIDLVDRPTGEWVWSDEDASWKCGRCDYVFEEIDWKPNYNFCPNCGAKMGGDSDG